MTEKTKEPTEKTKEPTDLTEARKFFFNPEALEIVRKFARDRETSMSRTLNDIVLDAKDTRPRA